MSDDDLFHKWSASQATGDFEPISSSRLAEMFAMTARVGPANCWTGTSGTLAAMVRELLKERIRLVEITEGRTP